MESRKYLRLQSDPRRSARTARGLTVIKPEPRGLQTPTACTIRKSPTVTRLSSELKAAEQRNPFETFIAKQEKCVARDLNLWTNLVKFCCLV